jgi:hypothetical protein
MPLLAAPPQTSGAATASDLIEPLVWALSSTIKLLTIGNPVLEELFARLRSSAAGVAGESVEALVCAVRDGGRPQLFAGLGGAMFVGWSLGRHSQRKNSPFFEARYPMEVMMSLGTVLLIILILLLLGALPTWPYSTGWGYYPSSGLGLVVLLLVILLLTGRI